MVTHPKAPHLRAFALLSPLPYSDRPFGLLGTEGFLIFRTSELKLGNGDRLIIIFCLLLLIQVSGQVPPQRALPGHPGYSSTKSLSYTISS